MGNHHFYVTKCQISKISNQKIILTFIFITRELKPLITKGFSPAGNRTRVARVTGGNTHHYTTEDIKCASFFWKHFSAVRFIYLFQSQFCAILNKTIQSVVFPEISTFQLVNFLKLCHIIIYDKGDIAFSPAGNRTRVAHVTGGNTHHYTTEDDDLIFLYLFLLKKIMNQVMNEMRTFKYKKYENICKQQIVCTDAVER
ncbi:hypothetical protein T4C_10579 [Trichinella pseudospiralis]|uniref:Uncharacterized protein n=1 Tax=Trichinella pseudospiralis TaxID=6337 RepID=A0A0V1JSR4_TRIPS|nr:hypothetical protein T4C_10579 [Trichinella pseudospiralis]